MSTSNTIAVNKRRVLVYSSIQSTLGLIGMLLLRHSAAFPAILILTGVTFALTGWLAGGFARDSRADFGFGGAWLKPFSVLMYGAAITTAAFGVSIALR